MPYKPNRFSMSSIYMLIMVASAVLTFLWMLDMMDVKIMDRPLNWLGDQFRQCSLCGLWTTERQLCEKCTSSLGTIVNGSLSSDTNSADDAEEECRLAYLSSRHSGANTE